MTLYVGQAHYWGGISSLGQDKTKPQWTGSGQVPWQGREGGREASGGGQELCAEVDRPIRGFSTMRGPSRFASRQRHQNALPRGQAALQRSVAEAVPCCTLRTGTLPDKGAQVLYHEIHCHLQSTHPLHKAACTQ